MPIKKYTDKQILQFKEAFMLFDRNKDGKITAIELSGTTKKHL